MIFIDSVVMPSSHGGSPGFKSPIAHQQVIQRLYGISHDKNLIHFDTQKSRRNVVGLKIYTWGYSKHRSDLRYFFLGKHDTGFSPTSGEKGLEKSSGQVVCG